MKKIKIILILFLSSFCFQSVYAQSICEVTCFANVDYYPGPNEPIIIHPLDVVANTFGSCPPDVEYFIGTDTTANPGNPPFPLMDSLIFPAGMSGTFPISISVIDGQGNPAGVCWGNITITQGTNACNPDNSPPIIACNDLVQISNAIGEDFVVFPEMIVEFATDSCTLFNDIEYFITTDGSLTSPPATDSIIIPLATEGMIPVFIWAVDETGNASNCASMVDLYSTHHITGTVFTDEDQDCLFNNSEIGIGNSGLRYSTDGGISFTNFSTNIMGEYNVLFPSKVRDPFLEIILPNGIVTNCPTSINLAADPGLENHDFAFQLFDDCDQMVVDISTIGLRVCDTTIYNIQYCNYSTTAIDDVEVTITLPADMNMVTGSLPFTDLGNNQFLFSIGTVASADCGSFIISAGLDCNVPLGATRCVEASIVPNSCLNNSNWNGSTLRVTGECDDTENLVRFKIENIGAAGMTSELNYVVVEDVVMSMTEPIQLSIGGIETIELPANGSTWRVEIPQEAGHPSLSIPSAAIEGCGGYGSMGQITQFSTPDVDPYVAIDCEVVVGSWDPNDKQAAPTGYATENFIEANTSIEYKIRFQNTGTAPAFNVRLEDKISEHLDISSIETGASSHPYRVELKDDGLLIFHFENIMLPDSSTNLEESQGFVQFRIHQLPDNAIGTVIENTADIYFDQNEAVITNTVHHTIGTNFLPTGTVQTFVPNLKIGVAPNPFSNFTNITLEGIDHTDGEFELYDMMGRLVKADSFSDNTYRLERAGLSSGTYLFRFLNTEGLIANGKLVIQ